MDIKTNRTLLIHYKSVPRTGEYIRVPWLNLSGHWLTKAGFKIGDRIIVTVSKEAIKIKKVKTTPPPISPINGLKYYLPKK
ncbi:type I addiction module toxin, SymE family [Chitinophaga oryzae]|uniref:Type I addiction module toxin, SymE family n=1 Tax=Chitinophaga oryzae TaxID=2725414 RepID=A0AAE6ZCY4_9BACT|nr:SymE family type I addiction module toxin [Chitinophaga oryzae]QJB29915.1 type I addiction module toxin, SymE family [Chitinophaga oryzae]